jgi:hypothetical protein
VKEVEKRVEKKASVVRFTGEFVFYCWMLLLLLLDAWLFHVPFEADCVSFLSHVELY